MSELFRKSLFLKLAFVALLYGALTAEPHAPKSILDSRPLEIERVASAEPVKSGAADVMTHAHNDYEQDRPLYDALANGFTSVEADIWLSHGKVAISHLGWSFKGTLEELYLNPLQTLVTKKGSVYGDHQPFFLWLEIKDSNPQLRVALHELLAKYPMLGKSVLPILTGNDESKKKYFQEFPDAPVLRDSESFSFKDPSHTNNDKWSWYSLPWSRYFFWKGKGALSPLEVARLQTLVDSIHALGRKIRFWGTPDTEDFWSLAMTSHVDAIGTDSLGALGQFITSGNTACNKSDHEKAQDPCPVRVTSNSHNLRMWK